VCGSTLRNHGGYYTEQVDTLVKLLTSSLIWHEEALYEGDQGMHVQQMQLDTAAQQATAQRVQIEVLQLQDSVTVGPVGTAGLTGEILLKAQVTAANDVLAAAKATAAEADQRLAASIEEVRSLRKWADIVIPQAAQMAELPRVAGEQLAVTVKELAAEREKSLGVTASVTSLESQVASLEAQHSSR
jgi:hypothetical protein